MGETEKQLTSVESKFAKELDNPDVQGAQKDLVTRKHAWIISEIEQVRKLKMQLEETKKSTRIINPQVKQLLEKYNPALEEQKKQGESVQKAQEEKVTLYFKVICHYLSKESQALFKKTSKGKDALDLLLKGIFANIDTTTKQALVQKLQEYLNPAGRALLNPRLSQWNIDLVVSLPYLRTRLGEAKAMDIEVLEETAQSIKMGWAINEQGKRIKNKNIKSEQQRWVAQALQLVTDEKITNFALMTLMHQLSLPELPWTLKRRLQTIIRGIIKSKSEQGLTAGLQEVSEYLSALIKHFQSYPDYIDLLQQEKFIFEMGPTGLKPIEDNKEKVYMLALGSNATSPIYFSHYDGKWHRYSLPSDDKSPDSQVLQCVHQLEKENYKEYTHTDRTPAALSIRQILEDKERLKRYKTSRLQRYNQQVLNWNLMNLDGHFEENQCQVIKKMGADFKFEELAPQLVLANQDEKAQNLSEEQLEKLTDLLCLQVLHTLKIPNLHGRIRAQFRILIEECFKQRQSPAQAIATIREQLKQRLAVSWFSQYLKVLFTKGRVDILSSKEKIYQELNGYRNKLDSEKKGGYYKIWFDQEKQRWCLSAIYYSPQNNKVILNSYYPSPTNSMEAIIEKVEGLFEAVELFSSQKESPKINNNANQDPQDFMIRTDETTVKNLEQRYQEECDIFLSSHIDIGLSVVETNFRPSYK